MQQYIYDDQYKGQPRTLLILKQADGQDYRVFNGAQFLGAIQALRNDETGTVWKTEYNILKPIANKIGAFIEAADKEATES